MKYTKPSKCVSIWAWIWSSWNFCNMRYKREIGWRFFGFEKVREYEIPMGELRF